MDYLDTLLEQHQIRLKKLIPLEGKLRAAAILRNEYAGFRTAADLGENRLSVIAQLARTLPGTHVGTGNESFPAVAGRMFEGGIQGISIVTEDTLFDGSLADLTAISRISPVPVLARGIWTHPAEICQAIVSGADAINLVAGALTKKQLRELYSLATGLGLDAMVEVHTLEDVERALDIEADLVCINHRNLRSWEINHEVTESLIDELPASTVVLATGGISTAEEAHHLLEAGCHGVIIGEALMRENIPQELIEAIHKIRLDENDE